MSGQIYTSTAHATRPAHNPAHGATNGTAPAKPAENVKPVAATSTAVDLGTNTVEIADTELDLPVRFGAGHVMDADLANLVDGYFFRSFVRQQDQAAKLRAENLAKAKTPEDKAKYAPLTVAALQALYADYVPSSGGTRMSTMDKIRYDAAWQTWQDMVDEHNSCLDKGVASTVFNDNKRRALLLRKTNGVTVEDYREGRVKAILEAKSAKVQARLQAVIDSIQAARAKAKAATTAEEVVVITEGVDDFA